MTPDPGRAARAPRAAPRTGHPRRVLAACVALSLLTLAYAVAELAIGYTYLPGRHGGLLLSGVPTLLIAAAALVFCAVSASVVADHVDARDNTAAYRRARIVLLKIGVGLLLVAPFAEAGLQALHALGGPAPPRFAGFAPDATLHDPALAHHGARIGGLARSPVLLGLVAASLVVGLLALLADRIGLRVWPPVRALTAIAFCLLCAAFLLLQGLESLLLGEVALRRYGIVRADAHPAAFNAVLLVKGMAGTVMLVVGVLACAIFVRRGAAAFEPPP